MQLIKTYVFSPILGLMGFLPIGIIRAIGGFVGRFGLKVSKKARIRTKHNLLITGIATNDDVDELTKSVASELGKTLLETICIAWVRSKKHCYKLIKRWDGLDSVLTVQNSGHPIIFLTPHLGNFEILVKAAAYNFNKPLTILYKPSKDKWFHQLMLKGRTENNIIPVPTNSRGVLKLIRALKNGEYIGVLPDSVASKGDGVWVDFFGAPVFATTLLAKLIQAKADAKIFIAISKRTSGGFEGQFIPYKPNGESVEILVQDIYSKIEEAVKIAPTEYFWSYDRFRTPDHARANN